MESDYEPSEDSLNVHDLSALDFALSSDSECSNVETPKQQKTLGSCDKGTGENVDFAKRLSILQCNISKSLSLSDRNNETVSSDASLGLLSDEKLSFNDDNILGMTHTIVNAGDSPNSDKENTAVRLPPTLNLSGRNDNMSLLAGGGDVFNTPIVTKSLSNATPASAGSMKKVSFNEKVLQSSYLSLDSHNSDDTSIQNSVFGLPDTNMASAFRNDVQLTTDSTLTLISPRKSSESTLKTDSNTSNLLAQLQQLTIELPSNLTTDPSEPFSLSSENMAKSNSKDENPPMSVDTQAHNEGCNNNESKSELFEVDGYAASDKSDTFYKSFSVSKEKNACDTPMMELLADESFRPAVLLKEDPFGRSLNQADFSNISVEQDASLGEKIFKGTSASNKLKDLRTANNFPNQINYPSEKVLADTAITGSTDFSDQQSLHSAAAPVEEILPVVETHRSSTDEVEDNESLAEISASCESIMTEATSSEDDSTHVISLATIKATWPTLNSLMKAKEIANRFESLCSNPAPDSDSYYIASRLPVPQVEAPENPFSSKDIQSNRNSINFSRLDELLEYPLSDKSVCKPASRQSNASTSQPLIDLDDNAFANLSCIPSMLDSKLKETRGLSFSTPKSKNVSSLESTSSLLSVDSKNDKTDKAEDVSNVSANCLPSKYLNMSGLESDQSVFLSDSFTLATVRANESITEESSKSHNFSEQSDLTKLNAPDFGVTDTLKDEDVGLDTQVHFPDTVLGFSSTKELGIENNSDKCLIAAFVVTKCRLFDNELGPKVVAEDVFKVKSTLIIGPRSKKIYEIAFTPSRPGSYTAWISVSLKGTIGDVNIQIQKTIQTEAVCEQYVASFMQNAKQIKSLELAIDCNKQNLPDEKVHKDVFVEWNCPIPVKLNCCLFVSVPGSLVFVAVDDDSVRETTKVSFFAKEVDDTGRKYANRLTLAYKAKLVSNLSSYVNGKLELFAVNAEKRLLVASLPIEVSIIRQNLRVADEIMDNLILKCDNNYSPILFPIINVTNESVSVEIECDKSIIEVTPALFTLPAAFDKKVKIKVVHGNIPRKETGGVYFETPVTIFSNGVKQSVLNVKLEHPKFVSKRCLTFSSKCMLFRSPELFSPIVESLKIKNSTNETLAFSVYIENIACFEISAIDRESKNPGVHQVELTPGAMCKLALKFHSYDVKMEASYLTVRVKSSFLKYVIPLYGYSGHSQLQASWVPRETQNDSNFSEVLLTNSGIQDLCFVLNPESIGNVSVSPTFGVIKSREKKILKVLMDNRSVESEDLEINWGDALLKKLFDCCSKTDWESIPSPIARLMNTDYGSEMDESFNLGRAVSLSNRFLNFVNNTLFVAVGSNAVDINDELPESERSEVASSDGTMVAEDPDLREEIPNQVESSRPKKNSRQNSAIGWVVRPNVLRFPTDSQSFIIENQKGANLDFSVLTPDTVVAKPTRGMLGPKEEIIIQVWCSEKCGNQKLANDTLCVKIGKDIQEIELAFNQENKTKNSLSPSKGSVVSLDISESFNTLVNEMLKFPPAKVGDSLQATLSFSNNLSDRIKWVLSSVAPAFVKWPNKRMFKANYAVFRVEKSLGYLNAKEKTELKVDFVPMDIGVYFQHWELQITSLGVNKDGKFIRICFHGEARKIRKSLSSSRDHEDLDSELEGVDLLEPIDEEKPTKSRNRPVIRASKNRLDFPDVKLGQF